MMIHKADQDLLEEQQYQTAADQGKGNARGKEVGAAHEITDEGNTTAVDQDAHQAVVGEDGFAPLALVQGSNDVQHHGRQHQRHTDEDGADQNGVDGGGVQHCGGSTGPIADGFAGHAQSLIDRLQRLFKAKHGAEHEAEHHAGNAAGHDEPGKGHLLPFPQDETTHSQHSTLAQVTEHDAEQHREGDGHKGSDVHLAVAGQAVHIHEELEGLDKPGVLQLGGRGGILHFFRVGNGHTHMADLLDLFGKSIGLGGGHPAHQEEVIVAVGSIVTQVKCLFVPLQLLIGLAAAFFLLGPAAGDLFFLLLDLFLAVVDLFAQLLYDGLRRTGSLGQMQPLKEQGGEDAVDLVGVAQRSKIDAPVTALVLAACDEEDVGILGISHHHTGIAGFGQKTKTHFDVFALDNFVKGHVQAGEMAELRFFLYQFALLFFQIRFLALQLGQAVCQFLDLILILRLDASGGLCFQRGGALPYQLVQLLHFLHMGSVRVILTESDIAQGAGHVLNRRFGMEVAIQAAVIDHAVQIFKQAVHPHQFHFFNGQCILIFLSGHTDLRSR